ncbi:MAG: hypothetical protein IJI07_12270 [Flexilinea sp.]|nr:hypothetical protein [Flexilinea sp.]
MDWKTKTLLIYGAIGLVCGILAGITTINNAVENEKEADISLKEGAKIGLTAMDAMRKTVLK